jgi:hypothetical protein
MDLRPLPPHRQTPLTERKPRHANPPRALRALPWNRHQTTRAPTERHPLRLLSRHRRAPRGDVIAVSRHRFTAKAKTYELRSCGKRGYVDQDGNKVASVDKWIRTMQRRTSDR